MGNKNKGCIILTQDEYDSLVEESNKPAKIVKDYNKINLYIRIMGEYIFDELYRDNLLYNMNYIDNYLLSIDGDLKLSDQVSAHINKLIKSVKKEITEYAEKEQETKLNAITDKLKVIECIEENVNKKLEENSDIEKVLKNTFDKPIKMSNCLNRFLGKWALNFLIKLRTKYGN